MLGSKPWVGHSVVTVTLGNGDKLGIALKLTFRVSQREAWGRGVHSLPIFS